MASQKAAILAAKYLGNRVSRANAAMAASPETLFTVSQGPCLITALYGQVGTAIQAQATTLVLQNDPTGAPAAAALCASTDINGDAASMYLLCTGLATDALVEANAGGFAERPMLVQPGIINAVYGAASSGTLRWVLRYIPLEAAGLIVAS